MEMLQAYCSGNWFGLAFPLLYAFTCPLRFLYYIDVYAFIHSFIHSFIHLHHWCHIMFSSKPNDLAPCLLT
jgi:hypothetical protein